MGRMTRMVRIFLLFGLLILGLALIMIWRDDRAPDAAQSAVSGGEPRIGRSTLSHGGPVAGPSSEMPGRSKNPPKTLTVNESDEASKR